MTFFRKISELEAGGNLIGNELVPLVQNGETVHKPVEDFVNFVSPNNASETEKGLVQEATQAQMKAGTDVGSTGARLYVPPSKLIAEFMPNTFGNVLFVNPLSANASDSYIRTQALGRPERPFLTLGVALSRASASDVVEILSNITENVTLNRALVINNCTLTTTAEVTNSTLVIGKGNARINLDMFETSPGRVDPRFRNIEIAARTVEVAGNNDDIRMIAEYCKFTGANPILRGGFATRPQIFASHCIFDMNADYIFGETTVVAEHCVLKNAKAGGHIKKDDALSNISLSQNFKNCILESNGDNLVGGVNQILRLRLSELNSINGKNISGFQSVQARQNDFTANASQSEHITSTATGHLIGNMHNLVNLGGANLTKTANNQY